MNTFHSCEWEMCLGMLFAVELGKSKVSLGVTASRIKASFMIIVCGSFCFGIINSHAQCVSKRYTHFISIDYVNGLKQAVVCTDHQCFYQVTRGKMDQHIETGREALIATTHDQQLQLSDAFSAWTVVKERCLTHKDRNKDKVKPTEWNGLFAHGYYVDER